MKAYVRHAMGVVGRMEKPEPVCGPDDVICRPLALSPCSPFRVPIARLAAAQAAIKESK